MIRRGSHTVASIFRPAIQPSKRKGVYTRDRDICICYRYYYHYEINRIRMDDAVSLLEKEFFLSSSTIMTKLVDYADLLKDIVNNEPNRKELRDKYPHFSWN